MASPLPQPSIFVFFLFLLLLPLTSAFYGGNVVITALEGRGFPQLEGYGPFTGENDAYLKLTTTRVEKRSLTQPNSNNPTWVGKDQGDDGAKVILGMHKKDDVILLSVWDEDTGLEGSDDYIGRASFPVPSCWAGNAET